MKSKIIIILFYFFSNITFGQTENKINSDWNNFRKVTHQIGFCIFHSNQEVCDEHKNELANRQKTTPDDIEVHYFEMKKEWAQNRLDEWAKRQEQPIEDFMILFDVAQRSSLNKADNETVNTYFGFVIIDLTDSISLNLQKIKDNESKIFISSDGENAMMENFLWREFMSGRLGRYSNNLEFELIGKNTESSFEKFKEAFFRFQKKINK